MNGLKTDTPSFVYKNHLFLKYDIFICTVTVVTYD